MLSDRYKIMDFLRQQLPPKELLDFIETVCITNWHYLSFAIAGVLTYSFLA